MSAEWQRVEELFAAALERPLPDRPAFLDSACGDDASLRQEVESLLASHDPARHFFGDTPAQAAASLLSADAEPAEGRRVGAYRLLRELGHGGMGVVYLAERADAQYRKLVAIKLVRRPNSDLSLQRFHTERQILANLDHPGIARLLDGGVTDEGSPYLVMEYVEGSAIESYCESEGLSVPARLELFRQVCAAVHYAHQRLVVHRDIKPGNILVTSDGQPKLLDFGIAKLQPADSEPDDDQTATVSRMLTPEFASPEQIRGEPITTASDVYSLGVLLFRLLTGRHPYRFPSSQPLEVARVVCESEPARPSTAAFTTARADPDAATAEGHGALTLSRTERDAAARLRRHLRGDLDNIVLMALRKDPARRYSSVEQLSEDIRRHLAGLPVMARPDTFSYRSAKFVRRHKVGVAAAMLVATMLIAGVVAIAWQARIAQAERVKAERRFGEVRKLAGSLMFQLHDQIAELPGSTEARNTLIEMSLEYLDRLAEEAGNDASLQRELLLAYQRLGEVRGNPNNPNLGDTAGALASYQKALPIAQSLVKADPADAKAQRALALVNEKMGDLESSTGQGDKAVQSARRALAAFKSLADADPGSVKARQSLGVSHIKLGDILGHPDFPNVGDRAGALAQYQLSLARWQDLFASAPADATTRRYLGLIHERLGRMHEVEGRPDPAIGSYRESLRIRESLSADFPNNANARRDVAIGYEKVADVTAPTDPDGALAQYRKALAIFEALAAADPKNAHARRSLAIEYEKIGDVLASRDAAGALEIYRKSLGIREKLSTGDPTNFQLRRDLAGTYSKLGGFYVGLASKTKGPSPVGQADGWRQGRSWYQRSLDVWLDLRQRNMLQSPDAALPEEIAAKVAQCDAALATSGRTRRLGGS